MFRHIPLPSPRARLALSVTLILAPTSGLPLGRQLAKTSIYTPVHLYATLAAQPEHSPRERPRRHCGSGTPLPIQLFDNQAAEDSARRPMAPRLALPVRANAEKVAFERLGRRILGQLELSAQTAVFQNAANSVGPAFRNRRKTKPIFAIRPVEHARILE